VTSKSNYMDVRAEADFRNYIDFCIFLNLHSVIQSI
jgi:predicted transcriptional regulator